MTSIYSADNPYYAECPMTAQMYSYRDNSVMYIIYKKSPVFAHCLQKADLDTWVDSPDFQSTCFVPSTQYCARYLNKFKDIDIATARKIVMSSIIRGIIKPVQLSQEELVPNMLNQYLYVEDLNIQQFMIADNGAIYFLNGVIDPATNYLD